MWILLPIWSAALTGYCGRAGSSHSLVQQSLVHHFVSATKIMLTVREYLVTYTACFRHLLAEVSQRRKMYTKGHVRVFEGVLRTAVRVL